VPSCTPYLHQATLLATQSSALLVSMDSILRVWPVLLPNANVVSS
jgi:hypothetical protein